MLPATPNISVHEQVALLLRGADHVYSAEELKKRLEHAAKTGRQLRVKLGMDPVAVMEGTDPEDFAEGVYIKNETDDITVDR